MPHMSGWPIIIGPLPGLPSTTAGPGGGGYLSYTHRALKASLFKERGAEFTLIYPRKCWESGIGFQNADIVKADRPQIVRLFF